MIKKINEAIKTLEAMLGEIELYSQTNKRINLETISIYNNQVLDMVLQLQKYITDNRENISIDEDTCFMAFNNAYTLINRLLKSVMTS